MIPLGAAGVAVSHHSYFSINTGNSITMSRSACLQCSGGSDNTMGGSGGLLGVMYFAYTVNRENAMAVKDSVCQECDGGYNNGGGGASAVALILKVRIQSSDQVDSDVVQGNNNNHLTVVGFHCTKCTGGERP
jgi:hypothetical protein